MRETYLRDIRRSYRNYRQLAEAAIAQVTDEEFGANLDSEGNTIAVIVQHVAGNLRSRFTDFLESDGEKPDRNRDGEFENPAATTRAGLMGEWNAAWDLVLGTLDRLAPESLERTVYIRGEAFAVAEALNRSVTHTAYHVGQIVFLAKHFAGTKWTSLSIPKGRSADYSAGTFKQSIAPRSPER